MAEVCTLDWHIVPFRSDRFLDLWEPMAAKAPAYGAKSWSLIRSTDDPQAFRQTIDLGEPRRLRTLLVRGRDRARPERRSSTSTTSRCCPPGTPSSPPSSGEADSLPPSRAVGFEAAGPAQQRLDVHLLHAEVGLGLDQQGRLAPLPRPLVTGVVEAVVDPGQRPPAREAVERLQLPVGRAEARRTLEAQRRPLRQAEQCEIRSPPLSQPVAQTGSKSRPAAAGGRRRGSRCSAGHRRSTPSPPPRPAARPRTRRGR